MKENVTKTRDCYHHLTRSSEYNFFVPPVKGQQFLTFYYNGIIDWNILPVSLKCIRNSEVKDFLSKNSSRESSDGFNQAQASDQFLATNKLATNKEICLKTKKIYKSKMYF